MHNLKYVTPLNGDLVIGIGINVFDNCVCVVQERQLERHWCSHCMEDVDETELVYLGLIKSINEMVSVLQTGHHAQERINDAMEVPAILFVHPPSSEVTAT